MTLATTAVFYLVLGAAVAFAAYLLDDRLAGGQRAFRLATALFFWPLHLPLLVQHAALMSENATAESQGKPSDFLAQAIAQVESELEAALRSLDGWAEGVLADEQQRLRELRLAWRNQAERIREIDRLLAQPEILATAAVGHPPGRPPGHPPLAQPEILATAAVKKPTEGGAPATDQRRLSDRRRSANIRRLQELRERMSSDFQGTLAWVRELATMIHLAKFSGAPASRGEELIAQIAAAVDGLQEASDWRDLESSTQQTPGTPAVID
jgi:hypothetical protein